MLCMKSAHACVMFFFFFFNDTATTEIYTLSLHDALPICFALLGAFQPFWFAHDNKVQIIWLQQFGCHAVHVRSEEHTSELQSRETISYAVFCLKKKKITTYPTPVIIS